MKVYLVTREGDYERSTYERKAFGDIQHAMGAAQLLMNTSGTWESTDLNDRSLNVIHEWVHDEYDWVVIYELVIS